MDDSPMIVADQLQALSAIRIRATADTTHRMHEDHTAASACCGYPRQSPVVRSCFSRNGGLTMLTYAILAAMSLVTQGRAQPPEQGTQPDPAATTDQSRDETAAEQSADPKTPSDNDANTDDKTDKPASKKVEKAQETPVDQHFLIPIPQRPYRTVVEIGFSGPALQSATARTDKVAETRTAVARVWGGMVLATVQENDWLLPGTVDRLARVGLPDVFERYPEASYDKVMLVVIEESAGAFHVACREYDPRIQELTAVRRESSLDIRSLGNIAGRLMRDSFRPALLLETANPGGDELELLLQAGEIVPPDPAAAQIAEGDILRTFMRHMERRNPTQLKVLQPLDLTYIRVTGFNSDLSQPISGGADPDADATISVEGQTTADMNYIDRSHVTGTLISHLPFAPFGQRGRSVQQMAVRQRPTADHSSVQLVLNSRTDRPLVCHRVDKVAKLRWRQESELPSVRLVSDRNGRIEIDVDPDHPTFWLYVYSGALLLARVPYAPGLLPEDTIRLPDDSLRLGVEGELYLFRDKLVDIVARRAVFKSLAKKASAAGNVEDLESAIKQLTELPGKREFNADLNSVKTIAMKRAADVRNLRARRKIERLCDAMGDSLDEFFSSQRQLQEMEEIQKLKEIAKARKLGTPVVP
jgi:hypothetical protein